MVGVNAEQAALEVGGWLDFKKIFQKARLESRDSIDLMEDMVQEGVLEFDSETNEITHNLLFPVGEEEKISKLIYKPRLTDRMLEPYMKGVKGTDADGRLTAYVAALTSQMRGIIKGLDSQDKKISIAIAVFFL